MLQWFIGKKSATHTGIEISSNSDTGNQQSAEELHQQIIKKFEKRKVYSSITTSNANFYLSIIKFTNHKGVLAVKIGNTNMNDEEN